MGGQLKLAITGVMLLKFMTVHLFQCRDTEQYFLRPQPTFNNWLITLTFLWTDNINVPLFPVKTSFWTSARSCRPRKVLFLHHGRPHLHDARVPWMEKARTGFVVGNPIEVSVSVFLQVVKGGCVIYNDCFHLHSVASHCENCQGRLCRGASGCSAAVFLTKPWKECTPVSNEFKPHGLHRPAPWKRCARSG